MGRALGLFGKLAPSLRAAPPAADLAHGTDRREGMLLHAAFIVIVSLAMCSPATEAASPAADYGLGVET